MKDRIALIACLSMMAGYVLAQSSAISTGTPVTQYSITTFPLYGDVALQSDTQDLQYPVVVRADAAAEVTVTCWGNNRTITVNLAAGEFTPCQIRRLFDSNTDDVALHIVW